MVIWRRHRGQKGGALPIRDRHDRRKTLLSQRGGLKFKQRGWTFIRRYSSQGVQSDVYLLMKVYLLRNVEKPGAVGSEG